MTCVPRPDGFGVLYTISVHVSPCVCLPLRFTVAKDGDVVVTIPPPLSGPGSLLKFLRGT